MGQHKRVNSDHHFVTIQPAKSEMDERSSGENDWNRAYWTANSGLRKHKITVLRRKTLPRLST